MECKQFKCAIFVVWIILSGVIFFILVAPFLFTVKTINVTSPKCEWKVKYNRECALCGMTRGFIHISHGDLIEASISNKFSIYLYFLFVVNDVVAMYVLIKMFGAKLLKLISPLVGHKKKIGG